MAASNSRGDARLGFQHHFVQLLRDGSQKQGGIALEHALEHGAAVALQQAWRRRRACVFVKELKQEKLCRVQREEMRAGLHVDCEACSSAGEKSADLKSRNLKKAWKDADELLFKGMARLQMSDRGDNWNERWQEAFSLPHVSDKDKSYRLAVLDAVYSDFVHTAVTYGRTIISEYFLHEYMKSVRPKRLGGVAGGKKYLWRGILFKLADGSQGPYGGSDEAAAKAAGHELRSASEYLKTGVGLCVPPMCLLDYKGFRMVAQAHVPLGDASLKMGSHDAGVTVLNECPNLDRCTKEAARALGLRAHVVGGWQVWLPDKDSEPGKEKWRRKTVKRKVLHTAADVEGHEGTDSRMYLLDLARAFPPEDPNATPHLSGMLSVSANVLVGRRGKRARHATVTKAHISLEDYDILYKDGTLEKDVPVRLLRDKRLFVYYRLLRPEFVRDRGRTLLERLHVPPDHKFPTVRVGNPMLSAIALAKKMLKGRGQRAKARTASTNGTVDNNAGHESRAAAGVGQRGGTAGLGDESSTEGEQSSDGDASPDSVELKEKEWGTDFVSKGETYFEGFVGEGEEDLMHRGGIGYPPCYDSILSDGYDEYDPPDVYCSDGDDSDDDDSDIELSVPATSAAVHGSELSQDRTSAGVTTSSANSGVCETAVNDCTGFNMASESMAVTTTVAPTRTKEEESDQKPSPGDADPGCAPAGLCTGGTAGSGCGEGHGLDQDPTATFRSEGGYHTFSEASLDPQYSQGMAGLQVNHGHRHNSRLIWGSTPSRGEGSSAGGNSVDTALGRDDERGLGGSVAVEPETFPLSGGGYSHFNSASLIPSGSSNPMPKPPDTLPTATGLGDNHGGQGASVSPAAGGGGNGHDAGRGDRDQEPRAPQCASGEIERRLDGVRAPVENGHARRKESPTPLSPDALTPFSKGDPEAKERNSEVTAATHHLITVVVPATAKLLCAIPPSRLSVSNLARDIHKHGVNVRHIGLLRAHMTPPNREAAAAPFAGNFAMKTSAEILRDGALVEKVVRTLKLVLRSFQRRWMKSEKSSSEQGMHLLVAQFLNLVTGRHERADIFWRENVTIGVCQRFGTVALTDAERTGLWKVFAHRPDLLLTIVKGLVKVTGVRFVERVEQVLRSETAESVIVRFNFSQKDIREIEAVVTRMAFLGAAEV
eukprot:g4109.t1